MVGDDVLQKFSGHVPQQNEEHLEKTLDELHTRCVDGSDEFEQGVNMMEKIKKIQENANLTEGEDALYDECIDDFDEAVKKLDELNEQIGRANSVEEYNTILKQQKQNLIVLRQNRQKAAEIIGVSQKTLEEQFKKQDEYDVTEDDEQKKEKGAEERDNDSVVNIEFKSCDDALDVLVLLSEQVKNEYGKDKELQIFVKNRLGQTQERKQRINREKNDKKREADLAILQQDIEIIMQEIQDEIQKIQENIERKKQVKEKDEQIVGDAIKEYGEFVENIDEKYKKIKSIQSMIGDTDKYIKNNKGIVKMNNPKTRAKKVSQFQKKVQKSVAQIEEEMQTVDDFEQDKNNYDEFITKIKGGYAKNKTLLDYIKNADNFVKKQEDGLKKTTNAQQRKNIIKTLSATRADIIDEINGRIKRLNQKKQNQKKDSVATKKDSVDALSLDDKDISDTLQLDNDELEDVDENLFSDEPNADVNDENVIDEPVVDSIEQKQKKRSDFFEERYGSDVYYVLHDGKNKDGFPIDDFLIKEYIVGTAPGKDRVIIEYKGNDISLPLKKFQSQWIKKGFVKDNDSFNVKKDIKSGDDEDVVDDVVDTLQLDDADVENTLQLDDDDLGDIDENLFSTDTSDESVTEESGTENVQVNDGEESDEGGVTESGESDGVEGELEDALDNLFSDDTTEEMGHSGDDSSEEEQSEEVVVIDGLEELSDVERSTIEQMFVGKKKLFEQLDKNDTDKVSEFWIDIATEIKEESAANDVRTAELVNIIKRNFGENVVDNVQNETLNIEENEEVDRIGIMEEKLGTDVLKEIILYTRAIYDEVEEGYDWSEYDDMEKEEIISDSMETVITNAVKMADAEYAQADFTKQDSTEIFRQIFIK